MDNFIERMEKEKIKILKENGAVDETGNITEYGISLLACLEADELYEEMELLYPGSMEVIYRFAEMFIDQYKHEGLLDIMQEMYTITKLPEPDYLDSLHKQPEQMIYFTEEIVADWGDYLMQDN